MVDWMFEVGTKLNMDDKGVIFEAVSLMDRFYDGIHPAQLPTSDL